MWNRYAGSTRLAQEWNFCIWTMCKAPPIGTRGTVEGVDDTASLLVAWDNGSHLNVIYGEDEVRRI